MDSERYAKAHGLLPYRRWACLLNNEVFIHGPFKFATMPSGRQSTDWISKADWDILHANHDMYANKAPNHELANLCSIHCSQAFHSRFESARVSRWIQESVRLPRSCYGDVLAAVAT